VTYPAIELWLLTTTCFSVASYLRIYTRFLYELETSFGCAVI